MAIVFNGHNPDVLECLANLSNDEVFTSVKTANDMLNILPQEIFKNKNTKFLDCACKTGVFLREIAKRLIEGLKDEIPDLKERINWIMTKQLFGIAITELTALISRRSLYCSKDANSEYSISDGFDRDWGNIIYEDNCKHNFRRYKLKKEDEVFEEITGKKVEFENIKNEEIYMMNNKRIFTYKLSDDEIEYIKETDNCLICGASAKEYGEFGSHAESHAYWFIHHKNVNELKNKLKEKFGTMEFDVIIGNPPYQLSDGCNSNSESASPLYNKFIEMAIDLNPRFLSMIIPSRWMTGGKGLDNFRKNMLNDIHLKKIVDFFDPAECFPGVQIKGGVCYFLRDNLYENDKNLCEIETHNNGKIETAKRHLLEDGMDTFIRYNAAINIIKKVSNDKEKFSSLVSEQKPYGFRSAFDGYIKNKTETSCKLYRLKEEVFVERDLITKRVKDVDSYKIFIPAVIGNGNSLSDKVNAIIAEPGSCCTETYLQIGTFKNKKECENVKTYISTKFFHFLLGIRKNTQNVKRSLFELIPIQDWSQSWDDQKLYKKYNLTQDEIDYIESTVWPEKEEK